MPQNAEAERDAGHRHAAFVEQPSRPGDLFLLIPLFFFRTLTAPHVTRPELDSVDVERLQHVDYFGERVRPRQQLPRYAEFHRSSPRALALANACTDDLLASDTEPRCAPLMFLRRFSSLTLREIGQQKISYNETTFHGRSRLSVVTAVGPVKRMAITDRGYQRLASSTRRASWLTSTIRTSAITDWKSPIAAA
jgi:hypothetical protein